MKIIYAILFLPLVLLFVISPEKQVIIKDLYSRKNYEKKLGILLIFDLAEEFRSAYFRNLFYFRINNTGSKILRMFYGGERTFIIDINTKIAAGVKLAHPYATILHAESIGENLYINHLVTVGEIKGKKPKIGDNVELHANCTIIGGITVGDNAIIGAGAVVIKDVPSGAVMVGNPARNIKRNV